MWYCFIFCKIRKCPAKLWRGTTEVSRIPTSSTGLTGLEPAASGVTDRHSNQTELQPPKIEQTNLRAPT